MTLFKEGHAERVTGGFVGIGLRVKSIEIINTDNLMFFEELVLAEEHLAEYTIVSLDISTEQRDESADWVIFAEKF